MKKDLAGRSCQEEDSSTRPKCPPTESRRCWASLHDLQAEHTVQALVASALSQLMTRAADHRQSGQLDRAASDYRLAESWGADPREIRQVMLGLKAGRVRQLIASGNFGQAEEALLDWELSEQDTSPIPRLYDDLKQARLKKQWEPERQKILTLIGNKDFSQARRAIQRWQNSTDQPRGLQKLSKRLTKAEQQEQQRVIAEKREAEWQRIVQPPLFGPVSKLV